MPDEIRPLLGTLRSDAAERWFFPGRGNFYAACEEEIATLIRGPESSPLRPDGRRISRLYYRTAPGSGYTSHWPGISAATGAGDAPSPSTMAAAAPPGGGPGNAPPVNFSRLQIRPPPRFPGEDRWGIPRDISRGIRFPGNAYPSDFPGSRMRSRDISRRISRIPREIPREFPGTRLPKPEKLAPGEGRGGRFLPFCCNSYYPVQDKYAFLIGIL